ILHHDLEPVKATGFRYLHFAHEVHCQVLVHDTVAGGKKSQHVRNKMAFAIVEAGPVFQIAAQVYFFRCPEAGLVPFVYFPYFRIVDGQQYKTVFVLFQQDLIFIVHTPNIFVVYCYTVYDKGGDGGHPSRSEEGVTFVNTLYAKVSTKRCAGRYLAYPCGKSIFTFYFFNGNHSSASARDSNTIPY